VLLWLIKNRITGEKLDLSGAWLKMQDLLSVRELTKSNNLDGRCFLHSYNWEKDKSGKALEAIMQGPMVVTQWINNHYYFQLLIMPFLAGV
jgi:hypothetical protein